MAKYSVLDNDDNELGPFEGVEALERHLSTLSDAVLDTLRVYDLDGGDGPYKPPTREYLLHRVAKYG